MSAAAKCVWMGRGKVHKIESQPWNRIRIIKEILIEVLGSDSLNRPIDAPRHM